MTATANRGSERPPLVPTRDILRQLDPLVAAAERIELLASHLDEGNAEVSIGAIVDEAERMRTAMVAYNSRCGLSLCELSLLGVPLRRTRDVKYLVLVAVAVHLGVADQQGKAESNPLVQLVARALEVADLASVYETFLRFFRNGYGKPPHCLTDLARRTRETAERALDSFLANYEAPPR